MGTDIYTKTVLTVIALCLLWLCALNSGLPVHAQAILRFAWTIEAPQPVVVVGWGTLDERGRVSLTTIGERPALTTDPRLPVKLVDGQREYSEVNPLPVSITQIKRAGEWEPIRSSVEEEPVRARPGARDKQLPPK